MGGGRCSDPWLLSSGSAEGQGQILQRFPEKDWEDNPFPQGIELVSVGAPPGPGAEGWGAETVGGRHREDPAGYKETSAALENVGRGCRLGWSGAWCPHHVLLSLPLDGGDHALHHRVLAPHSEAGGSYSLLCGRRPRSRRQGMWVTEQGAAGCAGTRPPGPGCAVPRRQGTRGD